MHNIFGTILLVINYCEITLLCWCTLTRHTSSNIPNIRNTRGAIADSESKGKKTFEVWTSNLYEEREPCDYSNALYSSRITIALYRGKKTAATGFFSEITKWPRHLTLISHVFSGKMFFYTGCTT